jgi:hypothetical protein
MLRRSLAIAGFAIMVAGSASAADIKFHAALTATAEVPPTKSTGSGEASMSLDTVTHVLTWDVTFQGFSSDVVAAHIHGPAQPGQNAGVVIAFPSAPTSPIHGSAKLTDEEQNQLMAGAYYVNIHTKNNPSGAVRGQLVEVK